MIFQLSEKLGSADVPPHAFGLVEGSQVRSVLDMDQVTSGMFGGVTVAVKASLCPSVRLASAGGVVGLTATETDAGKMMVTLAVPGFGSAVDVAVIVTGFGVGEDGNTEGAV